MDNSEGMLTIFIYHSLLNISALLCVVSRTPVKSGKNKIPGLFSPEGASYKKASPAIEQNKDRFIQELIDWLKIPSVSADPKFKDDVLLAADYLKTQFEKAGMENVQLLPTKGYPVVYADKITDASLFL